MSYDKNGQKRDPLGRKAGERTNVCARCFGSKSPIRRKEEFCSPCAKKEAGQSPAEVVVERIDFTKVEARAIEWAKEDAEVVNKQPLFAQLYGRVSRAEAEKADASYHSYHPVYHGASTGRLYRTDTGELYVNGDTTEVGPPYVAPTADKKPMVSREEYEQFRKVLDALAPGFYVKCAQCGGWFTGSKQFNESPKGPVCRGGECSPWPPRRP